MSNDSIEVECEACHKKFSGTEVDVVECPECGEAPLMCEICAENAPCPVCGASLPGMIPYYGPNPIWGKNNPKPQFVRVKEFTERGYARSKHSGDRIYRVELITPEWIYFSTLGIVSHGTFVPASRTICFARKRCAGGSYDGIFVPCNGLCTTYIPCTPKFPAKEFKP